MKKAQVSYEVLERKKKTTIDVDKQKKKNQHEYKVGYNKKRFK
jgi:hypothetical protein